MAMGGGLGSLVPYQQSVTPFTQGKGVPMNGTQPMPFNSIDNRFYLPRPEPERPPNPFAGQFSEPARPPNPFYDQFSEQDGVDNWLGFYDRQKNGPDNSIPMLGREQKSDLTNLMPEFQPMRFGDQFTDFMSSPEYKRAAETSRERGGVQTQDISRSDIFPDYMGSSSAIAPYERAYRDYEARLNAPTSGLDMGPGNTDFFRNAPRTDLPFKPARPGTPQYNAQLDLIRQQIPRAPFMQPQPFYGGLGGFLGGGYGFPMGPMYGGFRNRFGGFPMGMMPYQQPFYQQPVMGKGFNPFNRAQPQTQPSLGKGMRNQPIAPTQEEMTPLLDEFTNFYLNDFRPKYNAPSTASPYGSTLANQNLFGIGRLLSGIR